MYTSAQNPDAAAEAFASKLSKDGWSPYDSAGDTRFFKKAATRLPVTIQAAPGTGGKPTVQFSAEAMDAGLPALPEETGIQYLNFTKTLECLAPMGPDALPLGIPEELERGIPSF